MTSTVLGNDWCVGGQWEVNTWVWHQVSLEFVQIDIQSTVESSDDLKIMDQSELRFYLREAVMEETTCAMILLSDS